MASALLPSEVKRLSEVLKANYAQAEAVRAGQAEALKIFAGTDYPGVKSDDDLGDLVNIIRDAVQARTYSMAANRPRALFRSHDPGLKAWAKKLGRTVDAYSKRKRLEKPFQRCAQNAYFGLGVAKVAMMDSPHVQLKASPYAAAGEPSVADCSIDHLCWDMEAVDFEYCQFISDRYRARTADILSEEKYPASVRKLVKERKAEPVSAGKSNAWAENITGSGASEISRFEDWMYVTDVFIESQQCIYTFACDSEYAIIGEESLAEKEWDGKPTGPYSFLTFGRVPGNTKPSTPAQNLLRQHNLINTVYRKLADQIEHQKTVFSGMTGEEEDVNRFRKANDLSIIQLNNANGLVKHTFPGPDQGLYGILLHLLDQFNMRAANPNQKLGLDQTADTAKQEGMMAAAGSNSEAYDNSQFIAFIREIYVELTGLIWRDEALEIPMTLTVPNSTISVRDDWLKYGAPGSRRGDIADYDLDIDPYSLPYKPPTQLASEIRGIWNELQPAWPAMAEQGIAPDVGAYLDIMSRYLNLSELRDLFKFNNPAPPRDDDAVRKNDGPKAGGPREYIHRSAGAGSGSGQGGDNVSHLMASAAADNRNGDGAVA